MFKKSLLVPLTILLSIPSCSSTGSTGVSQVFYHSEHFASALLNNPKKDFNNNDISLNQKYVESVQSFSSDFNKVIQDNTNKIFSPVSIATCYSMLLEGARSKSEKELKDMLYYDDSFNHLTAIKEMLLKCAINDEENKTYLDLAQSFWVDNSFKDGINKDYLKVLEESYFAEAFQGRLDSEAMHQLLADYINQKTNNFLNVTKKDFEDLQGVLWLINTIYSKAPWLEEFAEEDNRSALFNNVDGSTSKVTYMSKMVDKAYYLEGDNYLISSLPLTHDLSFNILLPNKGADYQDILSSSSALKIMYNFNNSDIKNEAKIFYQIPKFEMRSKYDLVDTLKKLNVETIFSSLFADLSGIGDGGLYVCKSIHEAGIKVDNAGTEAAAYTIIVVDKGMPANPDPVIEFTLNRPFAYSITTSEGLPLFVGTTYQLD